jgi:hypothetical protein
MKLPCSYKSIPIFINSRDQLTSLSQLVTWLLAANYNRIYIIDNESTYPPLLEYFSQQRRSVRVISLGTNYGHTALWDSGLLQSLRIRTPFVYTDPDIVPVEACPPHVIEYFWNLLMAFPHKTKAGFGLCISDLPFHYRWKAAVLLWESEYWKKPLLKEVFDAPIDTTFALYRAGSGYDLSGMRTGFPYLARHVPWYANSKSPTAEQCYYKKRAKSEISTWGGNAPPPRRC